MSLTVPALASFVSTSSLPRTRAPSAHPQHQFRRETP